MKRLIAQTQKDSGERKSGQKKYRESERRSFAPLISLLIIAAACVPAAAHANIVGDFFSAFSQKAQAEELSISGHSNLQTMLLPKAAMNINPVSARGGGDVMIMDSNSLVAAEGPSGTIADIEKPKVSTISRYVVRQGDTLLSIAHMFEIPSNTIIWANDLTPGSKLQIGQELIILPVPGLKYKTKSGDTLASLAKKYNADATEIANFNGIEGDTFEVGTELIIPDGEIAVPAVTKPVKSKASKFGPEPAHNVGPQGSAVELAYFIAPLSNYIETQGIHGYNAVDLGVPSGTPILASASGEVVVAKGSGWNGGYGEYVVIQHPNGSQTLYSHMSKVSVYDGEPIVQGQIIGDVGQTGKATGPHLHFEIRNGIKNPF